MSHVNCLRLASIAQSTENSSVLCVTTFQGKTAKLLDFETESVDVDFAAEFKPMKNGGELSQGILQKMKEKRNILPDDLHYTTLNLTKLYTRPEISIIARKKDRLADTNEVDVGA